MPEKKSKRRSNSTQRPSRGSKRLSREASEKMNKWLDEVGIGQQGKEGQSERHCDKKEIMEFAKKMNLLDESPETIYKVYVDQKAMMAEGMMDEGPTDEEMMMKARQDHLISCLRDCDETFPKKKQIVKKKLCKRTCNKNLGNTRLKKTKRLKKTRGKHTNKKKTIKCIYFYMDGCPYCVDFEKDLWKKVQKMKDVNFIKINGPKNLNLKEKYNISTYPSLVRVEGKKFKVFDKKRTLANIKKFLN